MKINKMILKTAECFIIVTCSAFAQTPDTCFARLSLPCNRSVLKLYGFNLNDSVDCVIEGKSNPIYELRHHALMQCELVIKGYFTGKNEISSFSCNDSFPVFHILEYKVNKLTRYSVVNDLNPESYVYITNLPEDSLVSSDFNNGPALPLLDPESRSEVKRDGNQVEIYDFKKQHWYFNLKKTDIRKSVTGN